MSLPISFEDIRGHSIGYRRETIVCQALREARVIKTDRTLVDYRQVCSKLDLNG